MNEDIVLAFRKETYINTSPNLQYIVDTSYATRNSKSH